MPAPTLDLRGTLTLARTLCHAPGVSKKRLFETAAALIHEDQPHLEVSDIFAKFLAREKLGSTALGDGIAIPHCRIGNCQRALGTLITLADPIDFDAPDEQRIDVLFLLLVPEEAHQEHLNLLAGLARNLSSIDYRQGLRDAKDAAALYKFAIDFKLPA
ncbi:PTS fructose transporter subunit IIA [Halieaceae bacterium IMCC14734]|uniref:PTS fructose transporter subunit IIA n=1 Tax=Candidatus Litorirhabdus singularis TaxID=2518993 RepID=A0ABT3TKB9_9GAMM|nr:PTS sugar transporter subunit IIA [Candidatus Litorirhabdus singularis]MCX2982459.1 PTS fructose transporter subunit IIA [Candidatus Litorirhabdus singularis]